MVYFPGWAVKLSSVYSKNTWATEKTWLFGVYRGWNATQLYRDYILKIGGFFFVVHLGGLRKSSSSRVIRAADPGVLRVLGPNAIADLLDGILNKFLLGQWLNFKLFGITYLFGKIKFKLLFQGPLAKWELLFLFTYNHSIGSMVLAYVPTFLPILTIEITWM